MSTVHTIARWLNYNILRIDPAECPQPDRHKYFSDVYAAGTSLLPEREDVETPASLSMETLLLKWRLSTICYV
jgi:hypothetical protein